MIRRVRMARKRLAIARERVWEAAISCDGAFALYEDMDAINRLFAKELRKNEQLRAIERRKDRIA
jgi:hypothetical protein